MCSAAIDFTEIGAVQYLATDPSSADQTEPFASSGRSDDIWIVVANALFLHNVAWVGGRDNPTLNRSERLEPEVVSLALDLLANRTLIEASDSEAAVEDVLSMAWGQISAAATQRLERLA